MPHYLAAVLQAGERRVLARYLALATAGLRALTSSSSTSTSPHSATPATPEWADEGAAGCQQQDQDQEQAQEQEGGGEAARTTAACRPRDTFISAYLANTITPLVR